MHSYTFFIFAFCFSCASRISKESGSLSFCYLRLLVGTPGVLLAALGRFLVALGRSWALLGRSWALLGRSWAALGRSWAALGRSWVALGTTCKNHPKIDAQNDRFGLPKAPQNGAKMTPKPNQKTTKNRCKKRSEKSPEMRRK